MPEQWIRLSMEGFSPPRDGRYSGCDPQFLELFRRSCATSWRCRRKLAQAPEVWRAGPSKFGGTHTYTRFSLTATGNEQQVPNNVLFQQSKGLGRVRYEVRFRS